MPPLHIVTSLVFTIYVCIGNVELMALIIEASWSW
uniref:Uncharacterized protein n=1 Tax=Arundo donax TaxID=35708 RepID=A0A0A9GD29_ARUDO